MTTYATKVAARSALMADGYKQGFNSPGRPELWIRGSKHVTPARRTSDGRWVIADYPEPAVCNAADARALAVRDGMRPMPERLPIAADVTVQSADDDLAEAMRLAGLA